MAQHALDLVRSGILPRTQITRCDNHLATMWLHPDQTLTGRITTQRLGPLLRLPAKQRDKLTATLLAWLHTHGSAPELGELLHVHPQTIRYRLRQLTDLFGDALQDRQACFEMLVALRACARPRGVVAPDPAA